MSDTPQDAMGQSSRIAGGAGSFNATTPDHLERIDATELVELCALDGELFSRTFFPKTIRQASPRFHRNLWGLLESNNRLINAQIFRGGAKTTLLRVYTSKRIAYGLAHTILYIGKSEGHAARSVKWLRNQIEYNKAFASTFKLRKGSKWQDTECEIIHGVDEYPIWILGLGITGSVRGINLDDYRPDLIVIDDVIDEENSATQEQRLKIENLILGALKHSLAPASEAPDAKIVMLQTPLNKEDASCLALKDPEWKSMIFSCWTKETQSLPISRQQSSWPERYSTTVLKRQKEAAIERNKISLWNREMECKITSPETSSFNENWLKFYQEPPQFMQVIIAVDPVPPPTDNQLAKGLKGKDFESFAVVGKHDGDYYLLEYSLNRGHEPEWTIMEFFRLCEKWRPLRVLVETVAYQKTLSWLLKRAMQTQRKYYVIKELDDKRKKYDVIVDGLSGVSFNGRLFVRVEHYDFISQFREYPDVGHDDLIETVARCCIELGSIEFDEIEYVQTLEDERAIPQLVYMSGAP